MVSDAVGFYRLAVTCEQAWLILFCVIPRQNLPAHTVDIIDASTAQYIVPNARYIRNRVLNRSNDDSNQNLYRIVCHFRTYMYVDYITGRELLKVTITVGLVKMR